MKRYLICCEILRYEIEHLLGCIGQDLRPVASEAESIPSDEMLQDERPSHLPLDGGGQGGGGGPVEVNFLRKGYHENPGQLREEVQKAIDAAPADADAILLGYGLCGKGLEGVIARSQPLIIPRVHDCISLLLGSAQAYAKHFAENPGTYYYSPGWVEWGRDTVERSPHQGFGLGKSYEEYVAKYGEENARYLMELEETWAQRYTRAAYIHTGLPNNAGWEAQAAAIAASHHWRFESLPGSLRLLEKLLTGPWPEEEFVLVPPGTKIIATGDAAILCPEPAEAESRA